MKKLMSKVALLIVFLISFWGCQNSTNVLSESEKDSIIKEVRIEFDKQTAAATNHNTDMIAQYWWNNEDYLYASNGSLTKGWDANYEICSSIHTNPKNQTYTVDYDEINIRVLNRDAVMLTGKGYLNNFPTEEGPKSINLVVTFMMEKIDGNWVITVGHESTQEDLETI